MRSMNPIGIVYMDHHECAAPEESGLCSNRAQTAGHTQPYNHSTEIGLRPFIRAGLYFDVHPL